MLPTGRLRSVCYPSGAGIIFLLLALLFAGCSRPQAVSQSQQPVQIQLQADGQTFQLTSEATTVRELLAEAGVELGELDEVDPPLFTPLVDDLSIRVVRVTEELELITESVPFERKFVRTDTMNAADDPQIVQQGKPGLREVTVRLVYRDGLEASRVRTNETLVEEPQDEVVLIGIGANRGIVHFPGVLAYISGGTPVLMRGTTAVPEQLTISGRLDGRVFALSPNGSHLLYTQVNTNTTTFHNELWLLNLDAGHQTESLGVENVLWADWNPVVTDTLQIAYTTAISNDQPPGWEANNDLWLGTLPLTDTLDFEPQQIIETYPALNGWWGGNYAWSPGGRYLAYSFANEVGLIDTQTTEPDFRRRQLRRFLPFNTRADWVWVPSLTWSPDGRFLSFTQHDGESEEAMQFDTWVLSSESALSARFVEQAGMWGHVHWSPDNEKIAYLQTTDPLDSLRSNYTLWLMDTDGSNGRQLYPPAGENSEFSQDQHFMSWSADGRYIAFVYDNDLFMLNLEEDAVTRITQADTPVSRPTWAPYGGTAAPDTITPENDNNNNNLEESDPNRRSN